MTRDRRPGGGAGDFLAIALAVAPVPEGRTARRAAPVAARTMDRPKIAVLAALTVLALGGITTADIPQPEMGRYRAHVATLASREFAGRRGHDAQKAGRYVLDEFRRLGLRPGFGESYTQDIPDASGRGIIGRNVAARLEGSDPALKAEWIVVGAHFDHLGRGGGGYYPGADDNATGVAMLLEVARMFATAEARPRRSVLFVGFDLEEYLLTGSRHFAANPPVPLDRVKLFVTADMIGRSLAGVCRGFVFVFGAQTSPGLDRVVDRAADGEPVRIGHLGNDLLIIDRSDYGPFRSRSIPYLFFSTGENPDYHKTSDVSDTIDYETALASTRVIWGVLRHAASADRMPGWNGATEPTMAEALAVRDVFRRLLEERDKLAIGGASLLVLRSTVAQLDAIAARGKVTPGERSRLVRAAQFLMTTVL